MHRKTSYRPGSLARIAKERKSFVDNTSLVCPVWHDFIYCKRYTFVILVKPSSQKLAKYQKGVEDFVNGIQIGSFVERLQLHIDKNYDIFVLKVYYIIRACPNLVHLTLGQFCYCYLTAISDLFFRN